MPSSRVTGQPPSFADWNSTATKSQSKTPDNDFSFDLCHGNNEGNHTPERRPTNKCKPSPGVINNNRSSQRGNIPKPRIDKFPPIPEPYIHPGCGGYKKHRRTRKKSKKSAKHIKKIRKTISNKKNKKK